MRAKTSTRFARRAAALLVLVMAVAACGSGKNYGGGVSSFSPTAKPASKSPTPTKSKPAAKPSTKKAAPKPTATQKSEIKELTILGGECGVGTGKCAFEPTLFYVLPGTTIRVINKSDFEASWVSDDGTTFNSGIIAPGGKKDVRLTKSGRFPFHDGTRPSLTGEVIVT